MKTSLLAKLPRTATALGLALAASLSFAAPASAKEAPAATVETVDIDPALWVVKDEDTTIYLFGTIHILKPGLGWFDDGVKQAFDASDELVIEMIDPEPAVAQAKVMEYAVNTQGTALRDQMTPEGRAAYEKALASLGVPPAAFDQFEPWFAAINLSLLPTMMKGYSPDSGVEKVLQAAAKASSKNTGALETFDQQMQFLDGLSGPTQLAYVSLVAEGIDEVLPITEKMIELWGKGDVEGFAKLMNEDVDQLPELQEALLTKRNATWAEWIDARLDQPGTVFLAVGSAHLAGDKSVQDFLAAKQIPVERVNY